MPAKQSETLKGSEKPKYIRYHVAVNPETDPEIAEKLHSVHPMSDYIKQLIRKDLKLASDGEESILEDLSSGDPYAYQEIFHENFARLIKMAKVTNQEIAAAVHVSPKTVSFWRTGKGYPQSEQMRRICRFFGISRAEMLEKDFSRTGMKNDLLRCFYALSPEGKEKLMESAKTLRILYPRQD